jgi:hypothetical protein
MKYITSDYIVNNVPSIGGWTSYIDSMSGTLEWSNGGDNWIYATPNWNEDGEVPVDFGNEDGEYNSMWTIVFRTNSTLEEQLSYYIESVRGAIKIIEKRLV